MKRICIYCFTLTFCLLALNLSGQNKFSFLAKLDFGPLFSSSLGDFNISKEVPSTIYTSTVVDDPTFLAGFSRLNLGASYNQEKYFLDLTMGPAHLGLSYVKGLCWNADLAFRYRPHSFFTIGIHGGPLLGNPSWKGLESEGDIDLGQLSGFLIGCSASMGETLSFVLYINYLNAKMDVFTNNGWVASSSILNISGIQIGFGLRLHVPYPD
jgi:hypothetical protein